ncbi:isochorismatase family protein [Caenibacillus caldisaponilyticus]|uniref:isochorismatase family protein n=1 Tax=Caenibacillus caldisaponilyticus TaxID=1674942 RepID=UPI000988779D|nr:isochorismatase family protein [Caenibacillus caldisaponilyticus]
MKGCLLVLDPQKGILTQKELTDELREIKEMIQDFKADKQMVILFQHVDSDELCPDSPLAEGSEGCERHPGFIDCAVYIIQKSTPSGFTKTNLHEILQSANVDHLFIVGFSIECCCLFTAITGVHRGYQVTFIEDATGTVNDEKTYEMPGLDIRNMFGSILNWSNQIEVQYYDGDVEKYRRKRLPS